MDKRRRAINAWARQDILPSAPEEIPDLDLS
jgi:hypothetical protein